MMQFISCWHLCLLFKWQTATQKIKGGSETIVYRRVVCEREKCWRKCSLPPDKAARHGWQGWVGGRDAWRGEVSHSSESLDYYRFPLVLFVQFHMLFADPGFLAVPSLAVFRESEVKLFHALIRPSPPLPERSDMTGHRFLPAFTLMFDSQPICREYNGVILL